MVYRSQGQPHATLTYKKTQKIKLMRKKREHKKGIQEKKTTEKNCLNKIKRKGGRHLYTKKRGGACGGRRK